LHKAPSYESENSSWACLTTQAMNFRPNGTAPHTIYTKTNTLRRCDSLNLIMV